MIRLLLTAARWLRAWWLREPAAIEQWHADLDAHRCDPVGCTTCDQDPPELVPLDGAPPPPPPTTACPGHHGPCWLASMPSHVVDAEFGDLTAQLNDPED